MLDYCDSNPIRQPKSGQLKIPKLSRFPLPQFYSNMQGIFDNPSKKKVKQEDLRHQKLQDLQQQQFMKKHNQFMKKTINKMIKDSVEVENTYQKRKLQYKKPFSSRSVSIIKFKNQQKNKHKAKFGAIAKQLLNPQNSQNLKNQSNQTIRENIIKKPKKNIDKNGKAIPQFTQYKPKNNQKVRQRDDQQLSTFLQTRKKFFSQKRLSRQSFNNSPRKIITERQLSQQQRKDMFMKQIISLQYKQNDLQKKYGSTVQSNISEFHKKVDKQIEKINNFKFW